MYSILGKRESLTKSKVVSGVAVIYILLFSCSTIIQDFTLHKMLGGSPWQKAIMDIVMSFTYVWVLFFSTPRILWPLWFVAGATASFFTYTLGISINEHIIPVVFETNLREASGFISLRLILWVLFSVLVSFAMIWITSYFAKKDPNDKKVLFITVIFLFCSLFLDGGVSSNYLPYNLIKGSANYVLQYNAEKVDRVSIAKNASFADDEPLIVVMVIGESARASNFSLNGYDRNTNPLLQDRNHLINYSDVTACDTLTRYAVPCLITRATPENKLPSLHETSLVSVFKALGFYTMWIDMQGITASVFDSTIRDIAQEADKLISLNTDAVLELVKDDGTLQLIKQVLDKKKLLIVLHSFGSHWPFDKRYGDSFRKWTPICGKTTPLLGSALLERDMAACDHDALVNEYDNSILYTDFVLNSLISLLEDKNALFVYTSDHGESLGEGGHYMHGNGTKEVKKVPMIWWASDSFISKHPMRINALQKIRKASHNNIFHSLLDCAGITSPAIDPKLSLCR